MADAALSSDEQATADAERIRLLKEKSAIAAVSAKVPRSQTLHVPRAVLKFDRDETARHLRELVERRDEWDAFEDTHLKVPADDDDDDDGCCAEPAMVNASAAGVNVWADAQQQRLPTAAATNSSSSSSSSSSSKPASASASAQRGAPADGDQQAATLQLSGHRGPFGALMGVYRPCESRAGGVLHNGQLLYRLQRDTAHLQATVLGCVGT
jgi:hypothetical protein